MEMFNKGDPYPGIPDQEVAIAVRQGQLHPTIPTDCPKDMANLLLDCWAFDPSSRPTAADLIHRLSRIKS